MPLLIAKLGQDIGHDQYSASRRKRGLVKRWQHFLEAHIFGLCGVRETSVLVDNWLPSELNSVFAETVGSRQMTELRGTAGAKSVSHFPAGTMGIKGFPADRSESSPAPPRIMTAGY